jgi:hypothetical protein
LQGVRSKAGAFGITGGAALHIRGARTNRRERNPGLIEPAEGVAAFRRVSAAAHWIGASSVPLHVLIMVSRKSSGSPRMPSR